ncbi:hypothetical protein LIA77_01404 [Sarocladium implicatum]|nr:hypothetical protein LIA77_01404 [Sarocladium implicatum]
MSSRRPQIRNAHQIGSTDSKTTSMRRRLTVDLAKIHTAGSLHFSTAVPTECPHYSPCNDNDRSSVEVSWKQLTERQIELHDSEECATLARVPLHSRHPQE